MGPPGQTKNDPDLKFGTHTHTPLDHEGMKTPVAVTGWGYSLLAIPPSIIVRGLNIDIISPAFKLISQIIIKKLIDGYFIYK